MADRVYATRAWREVRALVLRRDGGVCRVCGNKATAVDHIIPWRENGAWYELDNLRAICVTCNSARVKQPQRAASSERRPSREW